MKILLMIFLIFFFTVSTLCSSSTSALKSESSSEEDNSGLSVSVYEVLKKHGLPAGLFPKEVQSYNLSANGTLEVHLEAPCYINLENAVYYNRTVRGDISYGQISGLSGMQTKELFLWFNVTGIRVDLPPTGLIYFDVGVVYKQFSLSLFESPQECQDGNGMGYLASRVSGSPRGMAIFSNGERQ